MAIKLGQVMRDRRGIAWRVVKEDTGYRYPFVAVDANGSLQTYTQDGRWSNHVSSPYDLIAQ